MCVWVCVSASVSVFDFLYVCIRVCACVHVCVCVFVCLFCVYFVCLYYRVRMRHACVFLDPDKRSQVIAPNQ